MLPPLQQTERELRFLRVEASKHTGGWLPVSAALSTQPVQRWCAEHAADGSSPESCLAALWVSLRDQKLPEPGELEVSHDGQFFRWLAGWMDYRLSTHCTIYACINTNKHMYDVYLWVPANPHCLPKIKCRRNYSGTIPNVLVGCMQHQFVAYKKSYYICVGKHMYIYTHTCVFVCACVLLQTTVMKACKYVHTYSPIQNWLPRPLWPRKKLHERSKQLIEASACMWVNQRHMLICCFSMGNADGRLQVWLGHH